jgi:hypothetical protein
MDRCHNEYIPREDAVQQTINGKTADEKNITALWTLASQTIDGETKQYPMFINSLKAADQEIPVGYTAPAGDYTFDLVVGSGKMEKAYLLDKVENKTHDLLNGPYSFSSGDVSEKSDRFVLFVTPGTITPEVSTKAADIYAYVEDSQLTVVNVESGDNIRVLDLAGRVLVIGTATDSEFRCRLSQKGVYIVAVQGTKTTVIKVLSR